MAAPWRTIQRVFVSDKEAIKLDLQKRTALAFFVCRSVISLYSDYFKTRFNQRDALLLAENVVKGKKPNKTNCKALGSKILESSLIAEEDGYSYEQVGMGGHLVLEMVDNDGRNCTSAIDCAGTSFAMHQLYVQGVDMPSTFISADYVSNLSIPLYTYSREIFGRLQNVSSNSDLFLIADGVELDMTFNPLPKSILTKIPNSPPKHEVSS